MRISRICRVHRIAGRHSILRRQGLIILAANFAPVHAAGEKTHVDTDTEDELADRLGGW